MTADDIKDVPIEDLANQRHGLNDTHPEAILIDNEIKRRARVHQHELDLTLVAQQVRWMKLAAILGAVTTLIGAIAGALLTFWLQRNLPPAQSQSPARPAQQQSDGSKVGDRTEKAVSVPSKPPESKSPQ